MYIKNHILRESKDELILAFALGLAATFILFAIYSSNVSPQNQSFFKFFPWYLSSIQYLLINANNIQDKLLIILFSIFLPLGVYICVLGFVIKYFSKIINLEKSTYIKALNLLQNQIRIIYNKSKYNLTLNFNEIKNLNIEVIITPMSWISDGRAVRGNIIGYINLNLIKNDNSIYPICAKPNILYEMSYLYKIIDYCKKNNINFSYTVMDINKQTNLTTKEFTTKIENYKKYGVETLSKNDKDIIVPFSIALYVFGIGLILCFPNNVSNFPQDFGLFIFLIPIFVSLFLDAALIIDNIKFPYTKIPNSYIQYCGIFLLIKLIFAVVIIAMNFI